MRSLLLSGLFLLLARAALAEDAGPREEIVKKVRYLLTTQKEQERAQLLAELTGQKDLDWASVKAGLQAGPYYQDPLSTEFGERHSLKHLGLHFTGEDKRERGFSIYLPKSYKAGAKMPVLIYLHHESYNQSFGDMRGAVMLARYRDVCEKEGILFAAPSTNSGAEWWTPDGRRLIRWMIEELKLRYSLDEDRIALMGAMDGGSACWLLGQEMPDTFSCLMPMSGNPIEMAESFRPLFMGVLDRTDILMGVCGKDNGGWDLAPYLDALKPMLGHGIRITMSIWPMAAGDFRYLTDVLPHTVRFTLERKRNPMPEEVDIETDLKEGQRSLWLQLDGIDPEGEEAGFLPSSLFTWTPKGSEIPTPKAGINVEARPDWPCGLAVTGSQDQAQRSGIEPGDVLLAIDGVEVRKAEEVPPLIQKHKFEEDVRFSLAREVAEEDADAFRKKQERYLKRYARRLEMEKAGQEVPEDIDDVEEGGGEEEQGTGETEISISEGGASAGGSESAGGSASPHGGAKDKKKAFVFFDRYVRLRRPEGPLVRADFGATWDPHFRESGVKLANVLAYGPAWRAGLRNGDVIVAVGDTKVTKVRDVNGFFETFDFKGFVDFTVHRPTGEGQHEERQFTVRWEAPKSGRVDAKWNKSEKIMNVSVRDVASFTLLFNEEMLKPGEPFHLMINGVPYGDLTNPAGASEDDPHEKMIERAKVQGWTPDPAWALRQGVERRDRSLVFGGKMTFDVSALRPGFAETRARADKRRKEFGARLEEARKARG